MKVTAKLLTCLCALLLFAGLTATVALAADQTAPTLVSTSPTDGATNVAADTIIKLTFSEPIVTTDSSDRWNGDGYPVSVQLNGNYLYIKAEIANNVMTIKNSLGDPWFYTNGYKVVVTVYADRIKDLAGNTMPANKRFTFTLKDTEAPYILTVTPWTAAYPVDPSTPIKLTYDEKVLAGATYDAIQVTNSLGQTIKITKTIQNRVLTISPASGAWDDERGYRYTLTIPAMALMDTVGHGLKSDNTYEFRTIDSKPPQLLGIVPANGAKNVRLDAPVVLVFDEAIRVDGDPSHYSLISSNPGQDQAHSYGLYRHANTLTIYPYDSRVWNNGYITTYSLSISGNEISDVNSKYTTSRITTQFTTIGLLTAKPGAVKASSAGYNSIQLTWTGLSGTTNYEIWRASSKTGAYTRVGITKNISFTSTALTTNTTYYYKVRACQVVEGKSYFSAWSDIVTAKPRPAPPGNVKAAPVSSTSAKVTWSKASGAKNYEIWRATSQTGTFTRVGITVSTSFTNTGLTTNTTYYYKVRAYLTVGGKNCFSDWSASVSAKPLPAPPGNVKAAPVSSSSAKITWNSVAGARNYEVWRAASPTGTYTRVGMTAATSFTNTGLTTNTTYYYKVRAYLSVGGKNCFSAWSTVVSAKP